MRKSVRSYEKQRSKVRVGRASIFMGSQSQDPHVLQRSFGGRKLRSTWRSQAVPLTLATVDKTFRVPVSGRKQSVGHLNHRLRVGFRDRSRSGVDFLNPFPLVDGAFIFMTQLRLLSKVQL